MHEETILELFYNDLECGKIKQNESYKEIVSSMTDLNQTFRTNLDENLNKQFNEILNAAAGLEANASDVAYLAGFRTGMRIAIEALYNK